MKNLTKFNLMAAVLIASLAIPTLSYADRTDRSYRDNRDGHRSEKSKNRHHYRYHDHPQFGLRISWIPDTSLRISLGGQRYYYGEGLYYRRMGSDYVIIAPPVGAVVRDIPPDYRPVIINGTLYYQDGGTYYVYQRNRYQVVAAPVQVLRPTNAPVTRAILPPAPLQVMSADDVTDESMTVNIANRQNSYTAVVLKRSGSGFLGPQGEFYPEFPKVSQLEAMYGQ